MEQTKDYYRILGVLNDAETIVIRAAFEALGRLYDIRNWKGDKFEANNRLHEINEAYLILSNQASRESYDKILEAQSYEGLNGEETNAPTTEEIDRDWETACEYYPKVRQYYDNLNKLSSKLSFAYKVTILNSQEYEKSQAIAETMERHFLSTFFGEHEKIIKFAKQLIIDRDGDAAAELNNVTRILGNKIKPDEVIDNINKKFQTKIFRDQATADRISKEKAAQDRLRMTKQQEYEYQQQVERDKQAKEADSKYTRDLIKVFLVVIVIAIGFYYFFLRVNVDPGGKQSTSSITRAVPASSSGDGDQAKDCNKSLANWRINIKMRKLEDAKINEMEFDKCKGSESGLSKKIDFQVVFSEEIDKANNTNSTEESIFPSGAKVNMKAGRFVTVGWQMTRLENEIETKNSIENFASAMKFNMKGYKGGHPEGASNIGFMYQFGLGVQRDLDKAIMWYGRAIKMGSPHSAQAEYQLARILHTGDGIYYDPELAKKYYQAAIDAGKNLDYADVAKSVHNDAKAGLTALKQ